MTEKSPSLPSLSIQRRWLNETVGFADLSHRGRLCALGEDRTTFLHGRLTNDIRSLKKGEGCYAAMTDNKGRVQADMQVYNLGDEYLIDYAVTEPDTVQGELNRYLVSEDVTIADARPYFDLITIQGPLADESLAILERPFERFPKSDGIAALDHPDLGQLYLANHARTGSDGIDVYLEKDQKQRLLDHLTLRCRELNGGNVDIEAIDLQRAAKGIPDFVKDMQDRVLPVEVGIDSRSVSYRKGCYIGQEVLNRLRTRGEPARHLVRLDFSSSDIPLTGNTPVYSDGKEIGHLTQTVFQHEAQGPWSAFALIKRQSAAAGTPIRLDPKQETAQGKIVAKIELKP